MGSVAIDPHPIAGQEAIMADEEAAAACRPESSIGRKLLWAIPNRYYSRFMFASVGVRVNPHQRESEAATRELCEHFHLPYHQMGLSGRLYPDLPLHALTVANRWTNFLFLFDDHMDDMKTPPTSATSASSSSDVTIDPSITLRQVSSYLRNERYRPPHGETVSPYLEYAQTLIPQVRTMSSPSFADYWINSVAEWMEKGVHESMSAGRTSTDWSVASVVKTRLFDMAPTPMFCVVAMDWPVAPQWNDPRIEESHRLVGKICIAINDLVSYGKEVVKQGWTFNYIRAWELENHCSFDEAVSGAVTLANQQYVRLAALRDEAIASDEPLIAEYLTRMLAICPAVLHWSFAKTSRYNVWI
jgi:hypothetical protein